MKRIVVFFLVLLLFAGCAPKGEAVSAPAPTATAAPSPTPFATNAPVQELQVELSPAAATATPVAVPTEAPTPEPTEAPEPTATAEPGPLSGRIIGVDPGHQLVYDPKPEPMAPNSRETKQRTAGGTRGVRTGTYEYEVNLAVGLELRDLLQAAGAQVVLTHEVLDVNISNIERAQMFNEANVDLGIRLHCNGNDNQKNRGCFLMVPSQNRTAFFDENVAAAKAILEAYCQETGLSSRYKEGITYHSNQTGFNWCTRPIVTIEMGHLTNPEEDALLSDPAFQKTMAMGLYKGILAYFEAKD